MRFSAADDTTGLSEALGGPAAPGIGFAIGEDRLVLSLTESAESVVRSFVRKPDVYIAPLGSGMNREAARLARELRRHDLVVDLGDEAFRLKKSFEVADKMGRDTSSSSARTKWRPMPSRSSIWRPGNKSQFRARNWRNGFCGSSFGFWLPL